MYIALQINVYKNSTLQIQQNYLSARDARKALLSPPKNESSSQICYRERRHRFSITKRVKGKSDSPAERGRRVQGSPVLLIPLHLSNFPQLVRPVSVLLMSCAPKEPQKQRRMKGG